MKSTFSVAVLALALVGVCRHASAEKVDETLFRWKSQVTFPGYSGNSTLRDFPALLRIPSGSEIYSATAGDSEGICFADAAGNVLPHEIDAWNPEGESTIWVSVPLLGGGASGIVMYVGGTRQNSPHTAELWGNANYGGVWHFSGSSADSSPSAMTSSNRGAPAFDVEGKVGTAFSGDGDDYIATEVVDSDEFDGTNFTLSAWVKSNNGETARIFSTKAGTQETGFELMVKSAKVYTAVGTEQYKLTTTADCTADYVYLTAVFRSGGCDMYVNGEFKGRKASGFSVVPSENVMCLGSYPNNSAVRLNGMMDELRMRFRASDADWAAADYATQTDLSFARIGELEVIDASQLIDSEHFRRKCRVSIKGNGVGKALYSFPVLIRIPQGSPVYDECPNPTTNLRFTDVWGFVLPHDVDCWDPTGESTVWVRLEAFGPAATTLWMYYKPVARAAQPLPGSSVWSSANYMGVWHFSGSAADSSGYGMDGTAHGNPRFSLRGKVGTAFYGDGTKDDWRNYDYIVTKPIEQETFDWTNFTISAWVKAEPFSGDPRVFSMKDSFELTLMGALSYNAVAYNDTGTKQLKCQGTAFNCTNDFVYLSATYCNGGLTLYANGTQIGSKSSGYAPRKSSEKLYLGVMSTSGGIFPGWMDEMRLRAAPSDASWVVADYTMQQDMEFSTIDAPERINMHGLTLIYR